MDAEGALATQLARLAAESFGQTHGLSPGGQASLAAAHLNQPVVALGQDFIQSGSECVFHAPEFAPVARKAAISIGGPRVRPA
jgi:hypothetical protein